MREIKFRAWDKTSGTMRPVAILELFLKTAYFAIDENEPDKRSNPIPRSYGIGNCEIMQFTGLHDRRETDIYEGDIVTEWDDRYRVEIRADGVRLVSADRRRDHQISFPESVVVIGNVWENPELLKA